MTPTSPSLLSFSPFFLLTLLLTLSSVAATKACPAGNFRSAAGACIPCPAGHYNWYPHAKSCTPCPPNTYTPYTGVVDRSLCLACPIDSYAPAGSASCMRCPVGEVQHAVASGPASFYHGGHYGYGRYGSRRNTHSVIDNDQLVNSNIKITNDDVKQQKQTFTSSSPLLKQSSSKSSSSSSTTTTNGFCAPCTHPSCLCSFHSCPSSVTHCKRSGYILPPSGVSYFAPSVCVSAITGCPGNLSLRQFVRRAICENPKTGTVVCPSGYLFDGVDRCVTCQPGAKLVYVPGKGKYHRKVRCEYCGGNSVSPGGLATKCKKCPCGYAPTAGMTTCFNTIPEGVEFSCK